MLQPKNSSSLINFPINKRLKSTNESTSLLKDINSNSSKDSLDSNLIQNSTTTFVSTTAITHQQPTITLQQSSKPLLLPSNPSYLFLQQRIKRLKPKCYDGSKMCIIEQVKLFYKQRFDGYQVCIILGFWVRKTKVFPKLELAIDEALKIAINTLK